MLDSLQLTLVVKMASGINKYKWIVLLNVNINITTAKDTRRLPRILTGFQGYSQAFKGNHRLPIIFTSLIVY